MLPVAAAVDAAQFVALADRLGTLAELPLRDGGGFAPNVVVGPLPGPLFDGKGYVLLAEFNVRSPEYLHTQPPVRLLQVTPLTADEAAVARDIGDVDTYARLRLAGINRADPYRPQAALADPVGPAEPPVGETIGDIWRSIDGWLREHAPRELRELRPGASQAVLADLERAIGAPLPEDYRASLRHHDGGGYLADYEYLSADNVARSCQNKREALDRGWFIGREVYKQGDGVIRNFCWHPGWIPFARDSVGNLLCVDTVPGWRGTRNQVISWERTSGPHGGPDRSFHEWLRRYRDDLLAGERYAVDDEGFIVAKV